MQNKQREDEVEEIFEQIMAEDFAKLKEDTR